MTTSELDKRIRSHLLEAFRGGNAFDTFDDVVAQVPEDRRFAPHGVEGRSAWQVIEHMRLSLDDIADYSANENGDYQEKDWPAEYWPKTHGPAGDASWDQSVRSCKESMARFEALIEGSDRDLLKPFPWAPEHTLLREILMAIQHNSYHTGELVELSTCSG